MQFNESCVQLYNSPTNQFAFLVVYRSIPPNLVFSPTKLTPSVYAFTIDKKTGGIYYQGYPNIDIFKTQGNFAVSLLDEYPSTYNCDFLGLYLIGATVSGNQLIIASIQSQEEVARIFNEPIYKITNVNFTSIPLLNDAQTNHSLLMDFGLCNKHYFCPTLDLSSKFPYPKNVISNNAFCWNKRFLLPFIENHCLSSCIIVLQGAVFSMYNDPAAENNIFYIIKRSANFPGTRYNARGLKTPIDPANECEAELIFLNNGKYYSQSWRRGSPPVFWQTQLSFLFSNHVVKDNASIDTPTYILEEIIKRFEAENVQIISLLHESSEQENEINIAYRNGVNFLAESFTDIRIQFHTFDLNTLLKQKGFEQTLDNYFALIGEDVNNSKFTIVDQQTGQVISDKDIQKTVYRFNCADSLDRTNVATFFYALYVAAKFVNLTQCHQFLNETVDGFNVTDPRKCLKQDVIDFLGNSFIQSGNIISLMYTNTDAIKTHLIRKLMTPQNDNTKNDGRVSVQRRFQNALWDNSRQTVIEEWTMTTLPNPKFMLDERYLTIAPQQSPLDQSIGHELFEYTPKAFSLQQISDLVINFPEPFFITSISFFLVENKIDDDLSFTLTFGPNSSEATVFFSNISFPLFESYTNHSAYPTFFSDDPSENKLGGVWVSYDLRKIARTSNYYPIDPKCLQPVTYILIRFNSLSDESCLGNIRFTVKRPNNPQCWYMITGNPVMKSKSIDEASSSIYQQSSYKKQNLMTLRLLELDRIREGINDYNRNNYLVSLKRNPWFYDLKAFILKNSVDQNCIMCGDRTDKETSPPFFFNDNQYPISFIKSDSLSELKKKNLIPVCKNCKEKFNDLNRIQYELMSNLDKDVLVNVNNYVGFTPPTFSCYDDSDIELNKFSDLCYNAFEGVDIQTLKSFLNGNKVQIPLTAKNNTIPISFSISTEIKSIKIQFENQIPVDSFQFSCLNYDNPNENIAVLNSMNSQMASEFTFSISSQRYGIEAILLTFQLNENYSDLKANLQSIQIIGRFKYLSHFRSATNQPPQVVVSVPAGEKDKSKKSKKKKTKHSKIFNFSEARGVTWNSKVRTQSIKYSNSNLYGIGIKLHSNKEAMAHSLLIGFYQNDQYCGHKSIIVPSEMDSNISFVYFPFSLCPSVFNNIVIFYLDRIPHVEPYKIMLLD